MEQGHRREGKVTEHDLQTVNHSKRQNKSSFGPPNLEDSAGGAWSKLIGEVSEATSI